ncbi:MAG: hypothetical protein FGM52_09460 [Mycobacterium sp.]|nr:hypothetical protein [Mycobacterium sp.]
MRLVVWNASMAVHRKLDTVLQRLQPDVLVLAEYAAKTTLASKYPGAVPWTSMAGAGKIPEPPKNPDKGRAVMTFGDGVVERSVETGPARPTVAADDAQSAEIRRRQAP